MLTKEEKNFLSKIYKIDRNLKTIVKYYDSDKHHDFLLLTFGHLNKSFMKIPTDKILRFNSLTELQEYTPMELRL